MSRQTALFASVAAAALLGCGNTDIPSSETLTSPVVVDTRPTSQSEAEDGNLEVHFDLNQNVVPNGGVLFSLDGRPAAPLTTANRVTTFSETPGLHAYTVRMMDPNCSMAAAGSTADSNHLSSNSVLVGTGGISTIYIEVDCASVLTHWGARTVTTGANVPESFVLTVTSAAYGSVTYSLPTNGSLTFGPTHVGWYHLSVTGVPAGCTGGGLGWIPPGSQGTDSIQIGGLGGVIYYYFACP